MITVFLFLFTRTQLEIIGFVPVRGEIMIIQSSNLNLTSARSYQEHTYSTSSVSILSAQPAIASEEDATSKSGSGNGFNDLIDRYQAAKKTGITTIKEQPDAIRQLRDQMMNYLLRLIFGDRSGMNYSDISSASSDSGTASETYVMQTTRYESRFVYSENETTSFSTAGTVMTADGRALDINLNLVMSRSFTEATSEIVDYTQPVLCDPLVINLDSSPATVSDQTFFFDLDADGSEEEISMLNSGSGYLALDKNGDGIINDGSELFGTKSGNGFADLSAYDEDGNGWIDEADSIFSKLKVWSMDEDGNSTLIDLKESGVGAIYLGSSNTDFSLKSADNATNAIVRRTGIFLYENGNVGTMQQLDLAVHQLNVAT